MDKRALLAIVLSFLILAVWTVLFAPRPPELQPPSASGSAATEGGQSTPVPAAGAATQAGETLAGAGTDDAPGGEDGVAPGQAEGPAVVDPAHPRREAPEGTPPTLVETDLARIEIASEGGRVISWTLDRYKDYDGHPYDLISPDARRSGSFPFEFRLEDKPLEAFLNSRARFEIETLDGGVGSAETAAAGAPDLARSSGIDAPGGPVPAADGGAPDPGKGGHDPSARADGAQDPRASGRGPAGASSPWDREVRLLWSDGKGMVAEKRFRFRRGSYLVDVTASLERSGKAVPGQFCWGPGIGTPRPEDLENPRFDGGSGVSHSGEAATRYPGASVSSPIALGSPILWAGLEEQYFAAVFIPHDGLKGTEFVPRLVPPSPPRTGVGSPDATGASSAGPAAGEEPEPAGRGAQLVNRISVAVPLEQEYTVFAGPKDFSQLAGLGQRLTDLVNFAPQFPLIGPLVGVLARALYASLRWLYAFIPNYGLAIILLTTAIRILFYPLTQRSMVKMRQVQQDMQRVAPKVKAIREKHRKAKDAATRGKANEEIMALYQREGINPMASLGGCLPLLLQLPILYGFYSVLTVSIELRQAPFFGWITDLSSRDPYYVTPLLMGVSMFLQQKMAMTTVTDPQQRAQQRMMLIMPFIFTYTFLYLPSGLVLYWFVNNILGIAQQVLINRQAGAVAPTGAAVPGKA